MEVHQDWTPSNEFFKGFHSSYRRAIVMNRGRWLHLVHVVAVPLRTNEAENSGVRL